MKPATFKADALLLLAALIWGTGFVAQRMGMQYVGPMAFTAVRFAIGALVLLPVIFLRKDAGEPPQASQRAARKRSYLVGGLLAGSILFVAGGLQQIGIKYTTAGKAGFITGLYVVFVPLLGLTVRQRVPRLTWLGVVLAATGLYFLSVPASWEINPGDIYTLACAVFWAVHVQVIGRYSPRTDPVRFAAVQFAVGAALATVATGLSEPTTVARVLAAKWPILYAGVISVGIAFTLQVVAQREAPPAHAAILLSLEAVFAAIAGGLILSERLGSRELLGCALMLAGGLASQFRKTRQPLPVP